MRNTKSLSPVWRAWVDRMESEGYCACIDDICSPSTVLKLNGKHCSISAKRRRQSFFAWFLVIATIAVCALCGRSIFWCYATANHLNGVFCDNHLELRVSAHCVLLLPAPDRWRDGLHIDHIGFSIAKMAKRKPFKIVLPLPSDGTDLDFCVFCCFLLLSPHMFINSSWIMG